MFHPPIWCIASKFLTNKFIDILQIYNVNFECVSKGSMAAVGETCQLMLVNVEC